MSSKLDVILARLDAIETRFTKCEQENAKVKRKVVELEERIEDLESVHRRDNVILSGSSLLGIPPADDCSGSVIELLQRSVS